MTIKTNEVQIADGTMIPANAYIVSIKGIVLVSMHPILESLKVLV